MIQATPKPTPKPSSKISPEERETIAEMAAAGETGCAIAKKIGRAVSTVLRIRRQLGYRDENRLGYHAEEPTPEEIKERAAAIRKEWSPREIKKRSQGSFLPVAWQVPASRERADH